MKCKSVEKQPEESITQWSQDLMSVFLAHWSQDLMGVLARVLVI